MEKIYYRGNTSQNEDRADVLISEKADFRAKKMTRDKVACYLMKTPGHATCVPLTTEPQNTCAKSDRCETRGQVTTGAMAPLFVNEGTLHRISQNLDVTSSDIPRTLEPPARAPHLSFLHMCCHQDKAQPR